MVKCNLKLVDYLDVTLNLSDGSYKPFHKPNSEINYIHRESNHHTSIIKQLPLSVESRLSKLSSDENVFIQAASVYQEALKRAGYNHKLSYNNSDKYNSYKIIIIIIIIMIIVIIVMIITIIIAIIIIRLCLIVMIIGVMVIIIIIVMIIIIIQGQANSERET